MGELVSAAVFKGSSGEVAGVAASSVAGPAAVGSSLVDALVGADGCVASCAFFRVAGSGFLGADLLFSVAGLLVLAGLAVVGVVAGTHGNGSLIGSLCSGSRSGSGLGFARVSLSRSGSG